MAEFKYTLTKFFKDWMLVICMIVGAAAYLLYRQMPFLHPAGPALYSVVTHLQPVLLFAMLFLSFCKIEPQQMRPHKWMLWLLLFQIGAYLLLMLGVMAVKTHGFSLWGLSSSGWIIVLEAAMLCFICPTATACAVVTGKLGGNMAGVITYTVLINLAVAIVVPLTVPLMQPESGVTFFSAFSKILAKVFPLLIMPCFCAWLVRYLLPGAHRWFVSHVGLSFYIWTVALSLAILMSTRAIVHSGQPAILAWIAGFSLVACILQFGCGKAIGSHYGCRISAGQSLGQKNTVFAIWMGYTFFDPVSSVAGGFYSIWHNCFNTWQLYKRRKL